jgi:spore coat polysaccharide biosynthesis protein SpsF
VATGIFIQVRLGSTRLPAKALLPLPGGCIIQHVMRSLQSVPADVRALLTDPGSESALASLARAEGFEVFAGPEEDVLARYCMASRAFGTDRIIRATGDNPLTSARLARGILAEHEKARVDLSHYLDIPWGSGVEVVTARALYEAEKDADQKDEREHITTFLYRHPERFRILEAPAPAYADLPRGRVTIDTPADLREMTQLFQDLYIGQPIEIEQVIAWLKEHQPSGVDANPPLRVDANPPLRVDANPPLRVDANPPLRVDAGDGTGRVNG